MSPPRDGKRRPAGDTDGALNPATKLKFDTTVTRPVGLSEKTLCLHREALERPLVAELVAGRLWVVDDEGWRIHSELSDAAWQAYVESLMWCASRGTGGRFGVVEFFRDRSTTDYASTARELRAGGYWADDPDDDCWRILPLALAVPDDDPRDELAARRRRRAGAS